MALVAMPSVSENPSPDQKKALADVRAFLIEKFKDAGMPEIAEMAIGTPGAPEQPNPIVYGRWHVADGLPTVMLYGHYDVVRADDAPWHEPLGADPEELTDADPFDPRESTGGRLYGRGAADDKSGILLHLSTLRAYRSLGQAPPVNLVLVLEGEEEIGTGSLDDFIQTGDNAKLFQAEVVVIGDTGNVAIGDPAEIHPTVTTSLRGLVAADVTVATLDHDVHSGMFGGPAPDAFMVLVRMIDSLTDWRGDCAVAGLTHYTGPGWPGSSPAEEQTFRDQCGVLDRVQLTGSGSITQRVAGSPAVNVVGLDGLPGTTQAVNTLHHTATARISVRIAPDQDPGEAYQALRTHLLNAAPYGVVPTIVQRAAAPGYFVKTADGVYGGEYFETACTAAADAYGVGCVTSGLGGTIPTINVFEEVQEKPATVVMWGCEEPLCRIHGSPESVSYDELTRMTRAEINLLNYVAGQAAGGL
ncbi:MAG: dimer protein [Actinomycetota bacterium]|nr:dimer protein [Actinomycetota bacterium]